MEPGGEEQGCPRCVAWRSEVWGDEINGAAKPSLQDELTGKINPFLCPAPGSLRAISKWWEPAPLKVGGQMHRASLAWTMKV